MGAKLLSMTVIDFEYKKHRKEVFYFKATLTSNDDDSHKKWRPKSPAVRRQLVDSR